MTRFVLRQTLLFSIIAICAIATAEAQEKPFKIVGAGFGTEGFPLPGQLARPHWAVGQATHLGRYYGEGTVGTDSAFPDIANGIITGEFGSGSPFAFTAANGDKLVVEYGRTAFGASKSGTFTLNILDILGFTENGDPILLVEAHWVAEFVVQPNLSTGKFAGVRGSWIMDAYSEPFVLGSDAPAAYSWEGQGTLTFPKKK